MENKELVVMADVGSLTTTAKNGCKVSFERSVAFATKDQRTALSQTLYIRQIESGRFTRLIRDCLDAKLVGKSDVEAMVKIMNMANGRELSKDQAVFCLTILALKAPAEPKGQKLFYANLVKLAAKKLTPPETVDA